MLWGCAAVSGLGPVAAAGLGVQAGASTSLAVLPVLIVSALGAPGALAAGTWPGVRSFLLAPVPPPVIGFGLI